MSIARSIPRPLQHLALLALLTAVWLVSPAGFAAAAGRPSRLPRLHAARGSTPAILTGDGRQVLLRGVNVNQLGDYFQQDPKLPPTLPLRRADFAAIAGLGMDVVRLIVHWSELEPSRGALNLAYVQRIRQAVRWAKAYGIYVVLDMHQDAWGKYVATPPGAPCLSPSQRQHGWDGAPAWATLTDGMSTCFTGTREVAPAVASAFQNFYDDTAGVQSELVKTWARLARAFAGEPGLAGYDLLNEPNPGLTYPASATESLAEFYARAIGAIRAAERSVRGGFSHIAFFEPDVIWSAAGSDSPPDPLLITDPNVVFAPHLYGGSIAAVSVDDGYRSAAEVAARYATTVWSGEYGWFSSDPRTDEANIRDYAGQEDAHLWGGAWWDWKQSCGDPHQFADEDQTAPYSLSPSLVRFACPANRPLGIPATTRRILSRPYPRFAPGRLTALSSDPASETVRLSGIDSDRRGSCQLVLWVPGARRPSYRGTHLSHIRVARRSGGWELSACARGIYALTTH